MELDYLTQIAANIFADIGKLSFDGVGITRASYSIGENDVCKYLQEFAAKHDLITNIDGAGNLVFSTHETNFASKEIWTGSHLDSVPQGGNFDGLAGIVAGLLCLIHRKKLNIPSNLPLKTIAFRGEESAWFGKAYIGSSALFGKLSNKDLELKHKITGNSLYKSLQLVGGDIAAIEQQKILINKDIIKAYIELHIEQGPVLVSQNKPIAVVSEIRGNIRHNLITCRGDTQHSGTVPRILRKDAMFAVAQLIMRLDNHWRLLLERGVDLVFTTGVVTTDPSQHSVSKIPGIVNFSLEMRSKSLDTLNDFYNIMQSECSAISLERGTSFEFDRMILTEPAIMDIALSNLLIKNCQSLYETCSLISSGAGHDAALFAGAGIASGMLFIRNQNGSHNPNEAMRLDDFMLGVAALYKTIDALDKL